MAETAAAQSPDNAPETVSEEAADKDAETRRDKEFLDVILVTAKRGEGRRADLDGNSAQLDASEIDFLRPQHISESLNRLPGVYIHRNSGAEHLTAIRSPILTGGAGAGSFLYLEDGVPMRAAGFANVNGLFEAHAEVAGAVEVVRGPGSALYGSNAVHGLVNVITRAPSDDFSAFLDVSGSSFDRYLGNASVSDSFGEAGARHGLRASLTVIDEGGWRDEAGVDSQKATLRWDFDGQSVRVQTVLSAMNLNQETAGFIQGPDAYKNSGLSRTNPNPNAYRDAQAVRIYSRVESDLSEVWTLSLTPFARWTDMTFRQHFLPYQGLEENGHYSIGVLAAATARYEGGHELILGLDTEYTEGFLKETQSRPSFGPFPQGVHYDYTVDALVLAPFVHGEWQATDALRLVAGLRVEATTYTYDTDTPADTVGRFKRPADREDDFLTVTPKIGFVYDLSTEYSAFGSYKRGARAPQTTDLYRLQSLQEVGEVEEETIDAFELGLRGTWREGLGGVFAGTSFELVGFFMDKENFFFRDADGLNVTDGETRHVGVELLARVPLTETLSLRTAGTYARHTYRFDRNVARASEVISAGDDVDTAPRTLVNTALVWEPTAKTQFELEWEHVGEYFTDAANERDYPGHDVFNLRGSWDVSETLQLYGAVRNVTNTDYAKRADFAFGNERYFPGEDRAYTVGVRISR